MTVLWEVISSHRITSTVQSSQGTACELALGETSFDVSYYIRFQKGCPVNIRFFMWNVPLWLFDDVWWGWNKQSWVYGRYLMHTMVFFGSLLKSDYSMIIYVYIYMYVYVYISVYICTLDTGKNMCLCSAWKSSWGPQDTVIRWQPQDTVIGWQPQDTVIGWQKHSERVGRVRDIHR